jgi:hypothetical protein
MKQIFSSEKIISISAIIIALASIFIAVWEGIEIRNHNRLSVRPKIEIFFSPNSDQTEMSWVLINNGIGPGIITSSKIFIDDNEFHINNGSIFNELIEKLEIENASISKISSLNPGLSIKSGINKTIVGIQLETPKNFWEIHNRIKFEIDYESMYGESFLCTYPMESD